MSKTKSSGTKMTQKEKKQAQLEANRKAQLQWWVLGGLLCVAAIAAIVLISLFTEGSIGGHG